MKVKSLNCIRRGRVFNMTVDGTHNFVIQGGLISHNCDEIRYEVMRHIIPDRVETEPFAPVYDPLNQGEYAEANKILIRR